jgi:small subunit ribosomal protein S13
LVEAGARLLAAACRCGLPRVPPFTGFVVSPDSLLWTSDMPRLLGVDIPSEKKTIYSLQYLYGVGPRVARELCHKAGVDPLSNARDLHEDELARMASLLDKDYVVEGQLRRQVAQNISRLKDIASYRGLRHRRGLPVRGQRTRTNARTRKGPKKTVAGKKGVKDLK